MKIIRKKNKNIIKLDNKNNEYMMLIKWCMKKNKKKDKLVSWNQKLSKIILIKLINNKINRIEQEQNQLNQKNKGENRNY